MKKNHSVWVVQYKNSTSCSNVAQVLFLEGAIQFFAPEPVLSGAIKSTRPLEHCCVNFFKKKNIVATFYSVCVTSPWQRRDTGLPTREEADREITHGAGTTTLRAVKQAGLKPGINPTVSSLQNTVPNSPFISSWVFYLLASLGHLLFWLQLNRYF